MMFRPQENIIPQQKRRTVKPRESRESEMFIRRRSKLCDSDCDIVDEGRARDKAKRSVPARSRGWGMKRLGTEDILKYLF